MLYKSTYEMRMLSPDYYKFAVSYETFRGDRLVESIEESSVRRYVRRESVHRLLEQTGFEVANERVAYDGSSFTGREDRVVIEARRP